MAERHDFEVDQGSTWIGAAIFKDSNGDPYDLTGDTFQLDVRKHKSPTSTLLFSLTAASGVTVTPASGRVDWVASPTQTDRTGSAWYDLKSTNGAVVRRRIYGKLVFNKGVTE